MDSDSRSDPNPTPNVRMGKHIHHIGGISVEFPYQPYGSQLAFMGRVISTLDRAQRDGHSHALLESPTGTGKSLSLLCSTLAWQQHFRHNNLNANMPLLKANPLALSDPLIHGGGFVPETQSSSISESETIKPDPSVENSKTSKKKSAPTVFYASRTHSQITQLIGEYRKTAYRVPMTVLASRKQYCTNPSVRGKENVNEECKLLLKNREVSCPEFKNANKVKGHPSLKKGGCNEVHDIEDLVKIGKIVKGCSYFAACSMAENAQLVFCPYNYIINPIVRGAVDIDIKGAILILDEAHNIEDMARDAGSVNIEEDMLNQLQTELGQLCQGNPLVYQPLLEVAEGIISWMQQRKSTLEKREFQHYFSCWTGDDAQRELHEANITQQCFPILQECATKAIKIATDVDESEVHGLSGLSVIALEGLFSSLSYFFSQNGLNRYDYQLALRHYIKKDFGSVTGGWVYTFSLWCLNPGLVFKGIADLSLSVILTSGTLSPMNSFSSELGVPFGTCLEAPHVIDTESQLWTSVISNGPLNHPLNASYKTADSYAFQDAVGTSLEEIFKVVPGGSLVFFPSYKLMEKLCSRWRETGQWSQLDMKKPLFVEPRGGSQSDFDALLKSYYSCIRGGNKPSLGRKRKDKKINRHLDANQSKEHSKDGAAFLAVCRGKVSEGIDFSDENARVVIIVGIPFPNIHDIQVAQKKKYNDTYRSARSLLSGSEWYCYQAFRALNQAAGRCIRHKLDYGAIIFLDQRFRDEKNTAYISKWLRKSLRHHDSFDTALQGLKSFFEDIKFHRVVSKEVENVVPISDLNEGKIRSMGLDNGPKRKKQTKLNKFDHFGKEADPTGAIGIKKLEQFCQYPASSRKIDGKLSLVQSKNGDDDAVFQEHVDPETNFDNDQRCSNVTDNDVFSFETSYNPIDMEAPATNYSTSGNAASPPSVSKVDDTYSGTLNHTSNEIPDDVLCSVPLKASVGSPYMVMGVSTDTAEKYVTPPSTLPGTNLPWNLSVNSHYHKRRVYKKLPFVETIQELTDDLGAKNFDHTTSVGSPVARIDKICSADIVNDLKIEKSLSSDLVIDKRLQIFCLLCRNPLGIPAYNHYVKCSYASLSKVHLAYILNGVIPPDLDTPASVSVLISNISSVDKQISCHSRGQGTWSEEDGCVYSTIFCPFCTNPSYILGVQILAVDGSNVQLLDKILFYTERLHIETPESSKYEGEDCVSNPIEIECHNSGGWRSTKSKLRLPKRSN